MRANERLIVALDMHDEDAVLPLVDSLGDEVTFYKVNYLRLFDRGLMEIVDALRERDKQVFLDLKFWDVPETIRSYIRQVVDRGVSFVTVHGSGGIIQAAREEAGNGDLKILAVTVLTSLDQDDIEAMYGVVEPVEDRAVRMAQYLLNKGCDGVIASPMEAARLRKELDVGVLIVTPGVRMPGASEDDHKRVGDPRKAIRDGADYVVVGRPIYNAPDPFAAARKHIAEIQKGLDDR